MTNPSSRIPSRLVRTALAAALLSAGAFAHPGHPGHGGGLADGLLHPLSGLDHLLAMVAVGWIAARLGGRWRLALPLTFVTALVVAAVAGVLGLRAGFTEAMVALSLLAFAALLAFSRGAKAGPSAAVLTAFFGFFHGLAHGAEIGSASVAPYFLGFTLASVALHLVGLALGAVALRAASERWTKTAAAALVVTGIWLLL